MDVIKLTLDEHLAVLNELGYDVYYNSEEIPEYSSVGIYKKDKNIGSIAYEEKNMFYLYRDNRIVGNKDLSSINFSKRKIKNIRGVIHLKLHDFNLKFNGYNQLINLNDDTQLRDYIVITDNKTYRITKRLEKDVIEVESLIDNIKDEDILDELRKPKEKSLIYK